MQVLEAKSISLRTSELAQELGVSEVTIRRNAAVLSDLGLIKVTGGGLNCHRYYYTSANSATDSPNPTLPSFVDQNLPLLYNQKKILQVLEKKACWVRASELAQEVGVAKFTIFRLIDGLIQLGLVKATGKGTTADPRSFTLSIYADQPFPEHSVDQQILDALERGSCTVAQLKAQLSKTKDYAIRNYLSELSDQGLVKERKRADGQASVYVFTHFLILTQMLRLGTWIPAGRIKDASPRSLAELQKRGWVKKATKDEIDYYMLTANGVWAARKTVQKVKRSHPQLLAFVTSLS
nr:DeoR family transcriptional regulator [Shimazuella soli]